MKIVVLIAIIVWTALNVLKTQEVITKIKDKRQIKKACQNITKALKDACKQGDTK